MVTNESISVWHFAGEKREYIVAACDVTAAALALRVVPECRDKHPQRWPQTEINRAGHKIAAAHPGTVYRRNRRSETNQEDTNQ